MPADIPVLNPLWRPNTGNTTRDDRGLILTYAGWPVNSVSNLREATNQMNRLASLAPSSVAQVQRWIDEVENLESAWSDLVDEGTAHLGNGGSYEGPMPGTTLTREQLKSKADVLEWDTSLLRVKIDAGSNPGATRGAVTAQRISTLQTKILTAVAIQARTASNGTTRLVRS